MGTVKFVSLKKDEYNKLVEEGKDDKDAIYFTDDTNEIITKKGQEDNEEQNNQNDQQLSWKNTTRYNQSTSGK